MLRWISSFAAVLLLSLSRYGAPEAQRVSERAIQPMGHEAMVVAPSARAALAVVRMAGPRSPTSGGTPPLQLPEAPPACRSVAELSARPARATAQGAELPDRRAFPYDATAPPSLS
jgi:hypothetical protein